MIIIKQNNITIPRGISPSFVTTDHDISLQKKSVTITKNGVSTITPDTSYDALSSVKVTTDIHPTPKLQNIVKTYVENGNYSLTPGTSYDGIGNVSITIDVPEKVFKTQDKNISITENGDYNVSKDSSFDGMNNVSISVNVPEKVFKTQDKNENIVSNGDYRYTADENFDGLSSVSISVNVPEKVYTTQEKTAVPTTSEQRIIPDSNFDALSAVNISAVDSTIDSNIIPANIKKGISILGVEGTNEPNVVPMDTVLAQSILSDEPSPQNLVYNAAERDIDGYSNVEIERIAQERITKTITTNGNITINPSTDYDVIKDVNITVNVTSKDPTLQEKTIDASSLYNETKDIITETITPDNDFDGLSKVTYTRLNLAKNRTTVVGTLPSMSGSYVFFKPEQGFDGFLNFGFRINYQEPTVDASTSQQLIEPSTGYACFKNVTVNPVTSAIDSNIIPANIKKGVSILGVEGVHESVNNQEKTLAKSDLINNTNESVTGELVPDTEFTGMSKISYPKINLNNNFTVEFRTPSDDKFAGLNLNVPVAGFDGVSKFSYKTRRQDKTVTPSTTEQTVNCDSGYVGIRSVTVNPVTSDIDSNIKPENIKKGVSILGVEGSLETGTSTNYVPLKYIEYSDNVFYRLLSGNVNLARNFKLRLTYSKSNPYGYPISINNDTQHLFEIFDQANLATTSTLRYYDPDNDKSQIVNVDTDYRENRLIDYSFIHFKKSSTSDYYNNEVTLDFTDNSNVEPSDHVYTKSGNNMYAFARYLNGVLTPAGSAGLRIYLIQVMYHIDNLASSLPLMANFIPVIYNGQAGFLETNTKVFSANLGTGTPKYELL